MWPLFPCLTIKFGSGHKLQLTNDLETDYNIPNHIDLSHVGKITLLTPWSNALYNHEVKSNTTDQGYNYTIVCFLTVCNELYIVSNYFDVKGNKVADTGIINCLSCQ